MRWAVVTVVLLGLTADVAADPADDLVVEGQALAMERKYDEAIAKFRAAEAIRPSALHSCLIGLAHSRENRLDEALLEFQACRRRSSGSDPAPEWLDREERALADRVKEAARQRDQPFLPAVRPGPPSRMPAYLLLTGAGVTAIGAAVHLFVVRPARSDLAAAPNETAYDDAYGTYNNGRYITVGAYVLGGTLLAVGVIARWRATPSVLVGARPIAGGGLATLEWRR